MTKLGEALAAPSAGPVAGTAMNAQAQPRLVLHALFEENPAGEIRHCGWTGPDREEALEWVREMQQCFPDCRHWMRPIER
jgi:hypothetical protein